MDKSNVYYNVAGFRCLDRIERQTEDLCLTRCGIQQCSSTHNWGPRSRPQYHMHFVLDGCGYLEIDDQKYTLNRGAIFLIPPNTVASYRADPSNPWRYAWVSFIGNQAHKYVIQSGFDSKTFVRDCHLPLEKFSSLILEMLESHQLTIGNELKRIGSLFLLFSLLSESNQVSKESCTQINYEYSSNAYLDHALQFIQINYKHNILISDIADYIGITRSYLFNIFKQNLNMAPKTYLLHYRMDKAKHLLDITSDSIQDIAFNVGYSDPLTFSKMFRNIVGVSPSQYRQNSLTIS